MSSFQLLGMLRCFLLPPFAQAVLSAWDELSFLWGQEEISLWRSHLWTHILLCHSKLRSKQLFLCCTASLGDGAYFLLDVSSEVKCSLHPSHLFLLSSSVLPYPSFSCCQNLLSKQTLLLSMIAYIFPLKNKNIFSKCVIEVSFYVRVKYLWRVLFGSRALINIRKGFHLLHSPLCYVKCLESFYEVSHIISHCYHSFPELINGNIILRHSQFIYEAWSRLKYNPKTKPVYKHEKQNAIIWSIHWASSIHIWSRQAICF